MSAPAAASALRAQPCPAPERGGESVPLEERDVALLFQANYAKLCRGMSKILWGDREAAEEAVMDAFVTLYQRRETVHGPTAEAYLWRIAINGARTKGTRSAREGVLVDRQAVVMLGYLQQLRAGRAARDRERQVSAQVQRSLLPSLPTSPGSAAPPAVR